MYLRGKRVYLCGPIAMLADSGITWRDYITPILANTYGCIVDDPCKKTTEGISEVGKDKEYFKSLIQKKDWVTLKEKFYPIVRYDLKAVDKADFIIYNYNPNVPTVGSTHEAVNASQKKTPVLIKYDAKDIDSFNPWIVTFVKPTWIYDDWNDMFKYLDKINAGELDSSHWW